MTSLGAEDMCGYLVDYLRRKACRAAATNQSHFRLRISAVKLPDVSWGTLHVAAESVFSGALISSDWIPQTLWSRRSAAEAQSSQKLNRHLSRSESLLLASSRLLEAAPIVSRGNLVRTVPVGLQACCGHTEACGGHLDR